MKYNQEKLINEYTYGKGKYYNEYYDDDFDLITIDENSETNNDLLPKEKTLGIFRKFIDTC